MGHDGATRRLVPGKSTMSPPGALEPAHVLEASRDFDERALSDLAARVADNKVVMIGEASHGTSEFYTVRAALTRRLIADHGFSFVGVEGDWPPCTELSRFVQPSGEGAATAREALDAFERWPVWMWANWETADFAEWLREHNSRLEPGVGVGFFGLDVYSLHESLEAVVTYLREHRPDALDTAERAFACFEPYRRTGDGFPALRLVPKGCEDEVVEILVELRTDGLANRDGSALFDAEQNALVALNAERYYRAALRGGGESWNVRDRHMQETLGRLFGIHGPDAKGIVWAHNTHIGDARYTDMAGAGMVNIGQLAREEYGRDDVALVGLGTHHGTVLAGTTWGAEPETMEVPAARPDSWEDLFHQAGRKQAVLASEDVRSRPEFAARRDHRAIGVVYRPERERYGNYVPTVLLDRYDHFVFIDETRALHAIEGSGAADGPPDTFPWGV